MTQNRTPVREPIDHLADVAVDLTNLVADTQKVQKLIDAIDVVDKEYNEWRNSAVFGLIIRMLPQELLFRIRKEDIETLILRLHQSVTASSRYDAFKDFFSAGGWETTSANTNLIIQLLKKIDGWENNTANAKLLTPQLAEHLKTLFLQEIAERKKLMEGERGSREDDVGLQQQDEERLLAEQQAELEQQRATKTSSMQDLDAFFAEQNELAVKPEPVTLSDYSETQEETHDDERRALQQEEQAKKQADFKYVPAQKIETDPKPMDKKRITDFHLKIGDSHQCIVANFNKQKAMDKARKQMTPEKRLEALKKLSPLKRLEAINMLESDEEKAAAMKIFTVPPSPAAYQVVEVVEDKYKNLTPEQRLEELKKLSPLKRLEVIKKLEPKEKAAAMKIFTPGKLQIDPELAQDINKFFSKAQKTPNVDQPASQVVNTQTPARP